MYGGDIRGPAGGGLNRLIPQWMADPFLTFEKVLSLLIGLATVIAGIWFIYLLIIGGVSLIGSGGDKQAIGEASKKVTTGFIGLVIIVGGLFIVGLIGTIFDIDILNPGTVLRTITP